MAQDVTDNTAQQRFELRGDDGEVAAIAQYRLARDTMTFTHTEVMPGNEGKGIGSRIAKGALDDAKGRGLKVVPQCEFIAAYIERHAEYAGLLVK